ncbi:MAG: rhomboid family intramembrane serine protease [Gammaproteobacteria bacterium]|nr:rhomboid family intramembrane serine protease [Gammaproteobacteria bacterium]
MQQLREIFQTTTNRLVAINIVVFIILDAVFAGARSGFELYFWQKPEFHIWQLVSYMFLHGGWTHLAFNMLALWSFGRVLERVWGAQRFLFFYLVCGVGAALLHLAVANYQFQEIYQQILAAGFSELDIQSVLNEGRDISVASAAISTEMLREFYALYNLPAVGASGAVYGILVAFALLFPDFKVILIFLPIPVAAKYFVPVLLLIDLSAGLTGFSIFGSSIAHFAHIGGALVGFVLVNIWLRQQPGR